MPRHNDSRYRILPLLLIPLGFIVYAGALGAPFAFDDTGYIITNRTVYDLSNFTDLSGTRYVGFLSFALNYRIGGLEPFDYHLVNVLIHIANALLVCSVIKCLFSTPLLSRLAAGDGTGPGDGPGPGAGLESAVAFTVAAIFLVHPINTQAVTYISQRFASLATMFYLLSLFLFLRARHSVAANRAGALTWAAYAGSLASAVVAMKTKEISFTLPVVIVLIDYIFISSVADSAARKAGRWMRAPFYLTLLIIPLTLLGPDILGSGDASASSTLRDLQLKEAGSLSRYEYVLTEFRVIMTYIGLILFPVHQYLDYMFPNSHSIFEPRTLISFLVLSAFLLISFIYGVRSVRNRNRLGVLFAAGVAWFFITLSVESFLVPIQDVIFEHRVYLPGVGFILAVVSAAFMIGLYIVRGMARKRAVLAVMCAILVLTLPPLAYATVERNRVWSDEVALINESLERFPDNARLYFARSIAHLAKENYQEVIDDATIYIKLRPTVTATYSIRGIARSRLGEYGDAIEDFTNAIALGPADSMPYFNRGVAKKELGMTAEALEDFTSALEVNPELAMALYERGMIEAALGNRKRAASDLERACGLGFEPGCENIKQVQDGSARGAAAAPENGNR